MPGIAKRAIMTRSPPPGSKLSKHSVLLLGLDVCRPRRTSLFFLSLSTGKLGKGWESLGRDGEWDGGSAIDGVRMGGGWGWAWFILWGMDINIRDDLI